MSTVETQRRGGALLPLAALSVVLLSAAVALGGLVAFSPRLTLLLMAAALLTAVVWKHPESAALLTISVTPLVAGIDRGRLVPMLRPNEALVFALVSILLVRAWVQTRPGFRIDLRLSKVEIALLSMAVANSVLPIAWMLARGRSVEADDISYAMVLWKYLAVYAVVRATVRDDRTVRWCLWASIASASVVAVIGVLQALDLAGVRQVLVGYYAPFGYTGALAQPRGGSTLALPAATADLLVLNLGLVVGLWWKDRRHPFILAVTGIVYVVGTLAAAEFSSMLGLVVAAFCLAWGLGRLDLLRFTPVVVVPAVVLVWPVIAHRLTGFQGVNGVPVSWSTRWNNLTTYFWPELFSGWNPVLGVRPAARIAVEQQGTGFVWIESGYTWLLWGGGVPLLLAFCYFTWVACRFLGSRCRPLTSYAAVAALAALSGVVMVAVLMNFDPHVTYRGAADALFSLLALAAVGTSSRRASRSPADAQTIGVPQ